MSPLLKIRAERDQMSAIERRIADYILENAHLLRDYSSQQLADALQISQSSVVKFSQKLGFKGYPDLKFGIGESVAHERAMESSAPAGAGNPVVASAEALWRCKQEAESETRLINPLAQIHAVSAALAAAGQIFVIGLGEDAPQAQALALRLSLLDLRAHFAGDPLMLSAAASGAARNDVLLVLCEHGRQPALAQLGRELRGRGGKLVSVTRHTANPLRTQADLALLVSAHDERPQVEPLLYRAALQHLLDVVFLELCETRDALPRLQANTERLRRLLEP
jgi:DNA-binding MurR/RpiR family transcriptional regulator